MKDLYTFDNTEGEALISYGKVGEAYKAFFNELKIPYMIAKAHSGDIGGDISHEYHFPSTKGEDVIFGCSQCDYVINEELAGSVNASHEVSQGRIELTKLDKEPYTVSADAQAAMQNPPSESREGYSHLKVDNHDFKVWYGVNGDRSTLVEVIIPQKIRVTNASGSISHLRETEICTKSIKGLVPDIDLSVENPLDIFRNRFINDHPGKPKFRCRIIDSRVTQQAVWSYSKITHIARRSEEHSLRDQDSAHITSKELPISVIQIADGDPCPVCSEGSINKTNAIELGHTFHLGTRYSKTLGAYIVPSVQAPNTGSVADASTSNSTGDLGYTRSISANCSASQSGLQNQTPIQMGCHGIGISRMIAAVADMLADAKGLNWPRVMAPFEVVIIAKPEHHNAIPTVYGALNRKLPEHTDRSGPDILTTGSLDVIVDDREHAFVWKLKDADLIGYPIIVVLGRRYAKEQLCEVQCRRLGVKEDIPIEQLNAKVRDLIRQI